jgi:hypothetical protein
VLAQDSFEFTDESDDEDPDGELGRITWIEKSKKDIATAVSAKTPKHKFKLVTMNRYTGPT